MANVELIVKIPEEVYKSIINGKNYISYQKYVEEAMKNGISLEKIKDEVEKIEINCHIRDVECFRAGINTALNVINKYNTESDDKETA